MNGQTWIFGKAISPLFADRVTYTDHKVVQKIISPKNQPIEQYWLRPDKP